MNQRTVSHIVVVDDDRDIQDLIRAFFEPKGFKVTLFSDAESALDAYTHDHQAWDVLLSDLHLPKMSGAVFIEKIKQLQPALPIILITISKSAETAVNLIHRGAYDFIVKPLHLAQLQISVERALHLKTLSNDITELREIVKGPKQRSVIGRSPKFLAALDIAKRVASSNSNIFISGESGTGKEIFAQYIHNNSRRAKGPFIAINCSAIPETLLESELFGHAKGSFTGASDKKVGLFEEAENGTLFLDEIGDLSPPLQAKLLRVLQERKIKRVGENQFRPINTRIISATHKDLGKAVAEGNFRDDLFFRLNVIPIVIPPLRERKDDILPLAESFLKKYALENGSAAATFSREAVKYLIDNEWPGNVRELENSVERAVVLASGTEVKRSDFLPSSTTELSAFRIGSEDGTPKKGFFIEYDDQLPSMEEVIQKYIAFAVSMNGGAKDKTAKEIGIDRKTLYKRLKAEKAVTL